MQTIQIELRPLDQIKPYPGNPRQNDEAVDAVAASLKEFGFRQPIVVDAEGVIIVGHTRYKAAQKLGLDRVPVHVATDLSPAQVKAYRIADNQTASIAEWDYELLPIELSALQEMNFELGLLGFDQEELQRIMSGDVTEGLTDPDDVPAPPDEAITKPGDLWVLGNHRLLCGDSSKPADVDRLLGGAVIHLVNTDPPYNVKVEPRSNNAIAAGLSSFTATKRGAIDASDGRGVPQWGAGPDGGVLRAGERCEHAGGELAGVLRLRHRLWRLPRCGDEQGPSVTLFCSCGAGETFPLSRPFRSSIPSANRTGESSIDPSCPGGQGSAGAAPACRTWRWP